MAIPLFAATRWLPTSKKEMELRGWEQADVILFTGDAYVDHPAFGAAVIGRVLENMGLKVAIVAQPNWRDDLRDFKKLGAPRLFFAATSGNMDSMVNHYTARKRLRSEDAYTAAGQSGARPDYALSIYSRIIKSLYPDVPLIIGGIEGSLRRLTHYDYWSDSVMPSILESTGADMLVYGLGEKPIVEITKLLEKGVPLSNMQNIPQTAFMLPMGEAPKEMSQWKTVEVSSFEDCLADKKKFAANFKVIEIESNSLNARRIIEYCKKRAIVVNPPYGEVSEKEIDAVYDLPFTRMPHPRYNGKGDIPAYTMIRHSINTHRGCFGGCSFCTISAHQGKHVVSRSAQNIMREVDQVVAMPDFGGHISDLGGPSANMYQMHGKDMSICNSCKRPSCIFPVICKNLDTDHTPMIDLYKAVRETKGVKRVSIGSGIRYDMLLDERTAHPSHEKYLRDLIEHHVSGRLKVAPEHTADSVLNIMRKPSFKLFYKFKTAFDRINKELGKKQQIIPYFISSHPGCNEEEMANLAIETKSLDFKLEQVQDFTPTPLTVSSIIYYAGVHPYTLEPIYVPKGEQSKLIQNRYFFWYKPENRAILKKDLIKKGRPDLIKALFGDQKPEALHPLANKPSKNKIDFSKKKKPLKPVR